MISTKRSPSKNIFNYAWCYQLSLAIARSLPQGLARSITRMVSMIWHSIDKNTRTQVESNLSRVIGNDRTRLHKVSQELFVNYGTFLADWAKLGSMETSAAISLFGKMDGRELFDEMYAKGNGIIILTAHLGNWELGGLVFSNLGVPFNVLTAKDGVNAIAETRKRVRALHNIRTITIEDGSFFFIDIINALKRNELVAMLVDRYEKTGGVSVDFFGEKTSFPAGPVLLARATGAPILPAFTVLGPDNKYVAIFGPPIPMEWTENRENDILNNVAKIAKVFERNIRAYPNQWYNFSSIWDK